MAHLVACPQCKKELRSALPYAAGATIQCPVCHSRFETATVTTTPASPGVAKTSPVSLPSGDAFADDFNAVRQSAPVSHSTRDVARAGAQRSGFLLAAA